MCIVVLKEWSLNSFLAVTLCLQLPCNKKGKRCSSLCERLTEIRVCVEMTYGSNRLLSLPHIECYTTPRMKQLRWAEKNVWAIVGPMLALCLPTSTKKKEQWLYEPWSPWEMPSSLYQCQCQCTVPAANQISSKSVLPDDYHGETNHHWPKVLLPQAIALLSPGSSRALTISSSSHIDFLFLLCFVWFGRISFLLV